MLTCSNVALNASSTFRVELNGTTPGLGYDQLNVRGTNNLDGTRLEVQPGFAPQEGDTFRILNNDGTDPIVEAFAGLTEGALFTVNDLPLPVVIEGKQVVTNNTDGATRFYRLHKP